MIDNFHSLLVNVLSLISNSKWFHCWFQYCHNAISCYILHYPSEERKKGGCVIFLSVNLSGCPRTLQVFSVPGPGIIDTIDRTTCSLLNNNKNKDNNKIGRFKLAYRKKCVKGFVVYSWCVGDKCLLAGRERDDNYNNNN